MENLPALFLLGRDGDNGALVLLLQLALGGVDRVVLDDCVDLALLVRNIRALSLHHCLLLSDVSHAGGVDTLTNETINENIAIIVNSNLFLLNCDTLILHLGYQVIFTFLF